MQHSNEAEQYRIFKSLPPVFIGGTMRTGTTLIQALLDSHPQLLVYSFEDCLIREFIYPSKTDAGISNTQKGMLARDCEQIFSSLMQSHYCRHPFRQIDYHGQFFKTGIDVNYFKRCFTEALSSVSERWNIYEVLMAWMFSYFRSLGVEEMSHYKGWVTKCPDRGQCIAVYNGAFPDCRVIHMVRDPRAFYISRREMSNPQPFSFHRQPLMNRIIFLMDLIAEYKLSYLNARTAQKDGKQNLLEVRYEDLVKNTGRSMEKVADFLGITFNNTLMKPTFRNQPCPANSSFEVGEEYDGQIFNSSLDRWKQSIRWYEKTLIESRLSDELINYGYAEKIRFRKFKKLIWYALQYPRAKCRPINP